MIARKNIFSTSEAAYAVDRNGRIIIWNQAAERSFGFAESEALGQVCSELLSGRDVFGNKSCCEGCPVRASAFDNETINRFKVDFKTADQERKRFTVSTLMLFNGPGKDLFVHLCRPELDENEPSTTRQLTNRTSQHEQRKTLTPRETEVLGLLHKGMTIPQIAAAMSISTSTVRNHTQHVLLKLNAHSRFAAVAQGRKSGLI